MKSKNLAVVKEKNEEDEIKKSRIKIIKAGAYLDEALNLLQDAIEPLEHYDEFGRLVNLLGKDSYEIQCRHLIRREDYYRCAEKVQADDFSIAACVGCPAYDASYQGGHPRRSALETIARYITRRANDEERTFALKIYSKEG